MIALGLVDVERSEVVMPWPAALNLVTITGSIQGPAGIMANGTVEFYPPYVLRDATDAVLIGTKAIVGTLVGGALNIQVPANDSPNVQPHGWAYTVIVRTDQEYYQFQAVVPSSPSSTTLDRIVVVTNPTPPATYVPLSSVGQPNGVVPTDGTNHIPSQYLPAGSGVLTVTNGDSTIAIGGTPANPTVTVGTVPKANLASAVQTSLSAADTAYQKPGSGVPLTDLTAGVQASLGRADTALQLAPAPDYALAYSCHTGNFDPLLTPQNSTINEQWFMRVLVRAGRQINLVKTIVRTAGTAGVGGLNGFALYSDDFSTLLWNSASDDTMWLAAGEVSKAVSGTLAGLTNRTPTVDTWFRVGLSARGHTAAPGYPFANASGSSTVSDAGNYRCRYRASAYSNWPSSINPAVDLSGVAGFAPPVLIG